jgi:hypothetical protein
MPRLLSKKMAVGAYVIWRCLESRTKSRELDLNFRHEKRGTVAKNQPPSSAQVIFQLLRVGSTGCLKPVKIAFGLFPPYGFLFSGFVFPFIY